MRKTTIVAILVLVIMAFAAVASAEPPPVINVDGVEYDAGPPFEAAVNHFYTPYTGADPVSAFTARNVWTGNGSDNLPCLGGYHWVDNENVLTISHCLPEEPTTTTTTTEPTTTTTTEATTTTTTVPETTTTVPETTTTTDPTTTTVPEDTTTTTAPVTTTTKPPELPLTGPPDWAIPASLAALGLIGLGAATLIGEKRYN